ncbi:MAG: hypothetical protein M0Q90_00920 [Bacteroidales bacterium]|nr:hypothetical protein [Bacteroidales bacterium]
MRTMLKPIFFSLATSLVMAILFVFSSQSIQAQELGKSSKESAKEKVKTEKLKPEKGKSVATEKSEKNLPSTKAEQNKSAIDTKKTLESNKREIESSNKADVEKRLAELKRNREEIELRKQHGKLTEKEYQDATNKLDKMEKELQGESKPKPGSKGGS